MNQNTSLDTVTNKKTVKNKITIIKDEFDIPLEVEVEDAEQTNIRQCYE